MKFNRPWLVLTVAVLGSSSFAQNSTSENWADWKFLLGTWVSADGGGEPGKATTGGCSFTMDLQGAVIVRKNHAEYPAAKDRPAGVHDDLMLIFHRGGAARASYFDSEEHEINYSASYKAPDRTWTFVSDDSPGSQRYRLTYIQTSPSELKLKFETAPAGKPDAFHTYIEATLRRQSGTLRTRLKQPTD